MVKSRRALVIAYCFPPHAGIGTFRTLRLVRRLAAEGWRVQVLTGTLGTYPEGTPIDQDLLRSVPAHVDVIRAPAVRGLEALARASRPFRRSHGPAPSGAGKTPIREASRAPRPWHSLQANLEHLCAIPDRDAGWIMPAVSRGLLAGWHERPDVIYSTAPPWTGQIVAYALASALRCPWIADFRDPWVRGPWRADRPEFVTRASSFLEARILRRADGVLFTTRALRNEVVGHHGPWLAPKSHVVRNGCDPEEFAGLAPEPTTDCFTLAHLGSLYGERNPMPLLRAIASAVQAGTIDGRRFKLRLIGIFALGDDLATKCRDLGLSEIVELQPPVSRRECLAAMVSASALLLVQPGHPLSVPGKYYEYLAASRPILALADEGETADLVRASGSGLVVSPRDEGAIRQALESLVEGRCPGNPPPPSTFDGRLRAAEMASFIDAMSTGQRGAMHDIRSAVREEP